MSMVRLLPALVLGALTLGLVALGSLSTIGAVVAIILAVGVLMLVALGPERLGLVLLAGAFLTAPMYKGLGAAGPVTPTDACLMLGFALVLPRLLRARPQFPVPFVVSVVLVTTCGMVAALVTDQPGEHLVTLVFWIAVYAVLPAAVAFLAPPDQMVNRFAWAFVVGHLVSTAWGITHQTADGRFLGLTQHPNAFGESGLLSVALCLHLVHHTRRRWVVWAAGLICLASIYESGSRGATIAVVGLVALVPVVERSALWAYLLAAVASVGVVLLATVFSHPAAGSSLDRLRGGASSAGSDELRVQGLKAGWQLFLDHPFTGSGLVAGNLFNIHNNYLEVLVSVGVFGFAAYVGLIVVLGHRLFGLHPMRRLCYTVAAYAAFGATTPSLTDRSIWVAISLSAVVLVARSPSADLRPTAGTSALAPTESGLTPFGRSRPR
jgi:O-antigen ligase